MTLRKFRLIFGALSLLALMSPSACEAQPVYPGQPCPYGYYYNGYGCYPGYDYGYDYDYPWDLGVGLDFYDGGWYGRGWHGGGWHGGGFHGGGFHGGGFHGGGGFRGGGGGGDGRR